jgi:hypothetical protein
MDQVLAAWHSDSPLHRRRIPYALWQAVPAPRDSQLRLPWPADDHGRCQSWHVGHQGLPKAPRAGKGAQAALYGVHRRVSRGLSRVSHVPVRALEGDGGRCGSLQGKSARKSVRQRTLRRFVLSLQRTMTGWKRETGRNPRRATTCSCCRRSGTMQSATSPTAAARCLRMPRLPPPKSGILSALRTRTSVCTWRHRTLVLAPRASAS